VLGLVAMVSGVGAATAVGPADATSRTTTTTTQTHGASPTCTVPAHLAKGRIVVPLVVDFGGPNGKVLITCVVTTPGGNGEQLLDDQAARLGYPQPSYCVSGLLWTIDGYPSSGCPANPGSDDAYWAYFHGGTTWTYATVGPAEWKVSSGDVEGWRYEPAGKADAPRTSSRARALEVRAASTTTIATTSTTTVTTHPPPSRSTGGSAGPRRPPGKSGTGPLPFIIGAALVLVLGAAALVRTRRAHLRSA
jgi:hypothetical protein